MYCQECHHTKWLKPDEGKTEGKNEDGIIVRIWKCGRCGHKQFGYAPFTRERPKELYIDVETSPNLAFLWSLRVKGGFVNPDMIIKDWFLISWAASWVGSKEVYSGVVTPTQARRWSDKAIIKPLYELINQADAVIGHNVDRFDIKAINTRFVFHGLLPPTQYKTIDTLKVARKYFKFESNKMDFISKRINGLKKNDMEFQDWVDCVAGKPEVLRKMVRYNEQDVKEGKDVYQKMMEWIPVTTGQAVTQGAVRV